MHVMRLERFCNGNSHVKEEINERKAGRAYSVIGGYGKM